MTATVFGQSMHLLVNASVTEDQIRRALGERGIMDADVRPIAPSLEDVFVALTANAAEHRNAKEAAHV